MECPCCRQSSSEHLCIRCVRSAVKEQRKLVEKQRGETRAYAQQVGSRLEADANALAKRRLVVRLAENVAAYQRAAAESKRKLKLESEALRERQQVLRERKRRLRVAREQLTKVQNLKIHPETGLAGAMLHGLTTQLEDSSDRVSLERKKLIMQLVDLFPINIDNPKPMRASNKTITAETIANLPLPSNIELLREINPDARAAAVAIVVRILLIASGYLSLPLPFKMEFLGSQASIGRWGEGEPQTVLAGTGLALESGMIMLRRNVEALCFYQGIPANLVKDWSLIHSLWQLFHSPSLGNSVHQSLLEADTRVARVPAGRFLKPVNQSRNNQPRTELVDHDAASPKPAALGGSGGTFDSKSSSAPSTLTRKHKKPAGLQLSESACSNSSGEMLDGENYDEEDEWNLMERPQPPKPSKDDDIRHWVSSGAGEA